MTSLESKLEAAKREHAASMEQVSIWNARTQRAAGAIEILQDLVKEEQEKPTPTPTLPEKPEDGTQS